MKDQPGKNFIAALLGVVLALSGVNWLASRASKTPAEPLATAQSVTVTQPNTAPAPQLNTPQADTPVVTEPVATTENARPEFDQGYEAGYRDGLRNCPPSRAATRRAVVHHASYAPRHGVAGTRYYAEHRQGHSTRNLILTIAGPAALGAGIGALAGGGKGAGAGALIGGGAGAIYHLVRHRN